MNSAWALRASGGGRTYAIRLWIVFLGGLMLGGGLSGAATGLLAALLPGTPSAASATVAALGAVALACYDLVVTKVNLPQRRSLIPQEVFFHSHVTGFFRFGLEFGSGVRTFVTSASPYILIAVVLGASSSFAQAVLVGLAFGAGRSIGPLQAVLAEDAYWSQDLDRTARLVERLGSLFATAVAVTTALTMLT